MHLLLNTIGKSVKITCHLSFIWKYKEKLTNYHTILGLELVFFNENPSLETGQKADIIYISMS